MMFKRVSLTFLLIPILVLLGAIDARSQTLASARILSSDGPVEIQRRSQGQAELMQIAYRVNEELFAGDVIKTLKGGRLVLGLADGSQAIIGEKTTLEILDLSKSPRTIFNVLRGKTRVKIEKVGGRPNPYRVNTPTTVIAVRGTLFDVFVTEKETQVFVLEGEVAVSNVTRPEMLVLLTPGLRTRIQQGQLPETPSRFQPPRNDERFKARQRDTGPMGKTLEERDGTEETSPKPRRDGPGRKDSSPGKSGSSDEQRERQREGERRPAQFSAGNGQG